MNMKVRCLYCNRTSFFYVNEVKSKTHVTLITECPKCHTQDDVFYFPISCKEKYTKDILAGKDPRKGFSAP